MVAFGLGLGVIFLTTQSGTGAGIGPSDGWTLHSDALKHLPASPARSRITGAKATSQAG